MGIPIASAYLNKVELLFDDAADKAFPKNQIICYQGDALSGIHMIKKGFVKAYTILDTGDTRTLFILGPGDIFPIAFSLTLDWEKYHLRYFYQAITDVETRLLEHVSFKRQIDEDPKKKQIYMEYMSASNQGIMTQLEVMKEKTAKNKVEQLLPYLVSKIGEKTQPNTYRLKIKLSHQEIADLAGITRETTTSLLKELEKAGVIKQKTDTWIIKLPPEDQELIAG